MTAVFRYAQLVAKHSRNDSARDQLVFTQRPIVTAVLIDGGFYRRRARRLFGEKNAEDRAEEVAKYARRHISKSRSSLYRIFYYDCPPSSKVLYHPLRQEQINLAKTEQYRWTNDFFEALTHKRKVALRRGEELETQRGYTLNADKTKKICSGKVAVADLSETDFDLDIVQKGVDMRIGLDIATLAERGSVNQIVMVSGDSDFVPAAKHARRSGIDFLLDPMWATISKSLSEHVDGIRQCVLPPPHNEGDPLHVTNMGNQAREPQPEDDEEL